MGVSGSGKSTLANALASALDCAVVDGDDLHLPASVEKMRAGVALDDADRWPWLDRIGQTLTHSTGACVLACSALRRSYRDRIRAAAPGVRFLFLAGDAQLIRQRMHARADHYMPPALLESQLHTLECPGSDEPDVTHLPITVGVPELVALALAALQAPAAPLPHPQGQPCSFDAPFSVAR